MFKNGLIWLYYFPQTIFSPMENHKRCRRFLALISLKLLFFFYIIIHLGYFVSIPFVPKMMVLRLPVIVLFTAIYVFILLICLNYIKVIPKLRQTFSEPKKH